MTEAVELMINGKIVYRYYSKKPIESFGAKLIEEKDDVSSTV